MTVEGRLRGTASRNGHGQHNVGNSRLIRGAAGAMETGGNERRRKREERDGKYGGPARGRRHRQDADPAVTIRSIYLGPRTSPVATPRDLSSQPPMLRLCFLTSISV